ncbi:unnamed protein product [Protopolystoma xenopodis]|uniref:Single-pass membrane and coiled-coil domain-containing protein 4 homolog n=1 Tax=Protopolystoma xenopodis TaxID=117903 RepID=A0A448WPD5_9PLAT|nr:unnamed protein product [Protopolystoma xenopodis]
MRKLRGGVTKETKRDKLQRRKDVRVLPDQIKKIVLPTLLSIIAGLIIIVFLLTRGTVKESD